MSLSTFEQVARHRTAADNAFDWSTDLCSAPLIGSRGRSFDFTAACTRHDFAYRNFKRADRDHPRRGSWWNSTIRHRIDLKFLDDMHHHCSTRRTGERTTCRLWAEMYFRMVRIAGGP